MGRRSKAKSKSKARSKEWSWRFFPLYGLKIAEDDGLHAPLWGDATLVAPEKLVPFIERNAQKAHPLLLHRKLADVLDADEIDGIGNAESLVEIPPHSYIAVRGRPDQADAQYRADRIRALLSATMFLRAHRSTAFVGSPQQFAWYVVPRDITIDQAKPAKTTIAPIVNPHIVQRPTTVSKSDLRSSVKRGEIATNSAAWEWDLYAEHPVSKLLNDLRPKPLRRRLIRMALQIQQASCSLPHSLQIRMAVTALEILFNTQKFSDLRARMGAYFQGERERTRVEDFFRERHRVTHEGFVSDENALALPPTTRSRCPGSCSTWRRHSASLSMPSSSTPTRGHSLT